MNRKFLVTFAIVALAITSAVAGMNNPVVGGKEVSPGGSLIPPFSHPSSPSISAAAWPSSLTGSTSSFWEPPFTSAGVCAIGNNLVQDDISSEVRTSVKRRIIVAPVPPCAGRPALLANSRCSIAFIVLVQLTYAIAPRLRRRS